MEPRVGKSRCKELEHRNSQTVLSCSIARAEWVIEASDSWILDAKESSRLGGRRKEGYLVNTEFHSHAPHVLSKLLRFALPIHNVHC
jgi:hypothetical protein